MTCRPTWRGAVPGSDSAPLMRLDGFCHGCAMQVVVAVIVMLSHGSVWADEADDSLQVDLMNLLAPLLSSDPDEHDAALNVLVDLGERVVGPLEAIAFDSRGHPRFRAGAVYVLGRLGAASSREVLQDLWRQGFEGLGGGLTIQTAGALALYGDFDPLRAVVRLGDELLGAKAAVQLGLLGDLGSLELLGEAFDGETFARMRPFFAIALGLLGDPRGEPILRACLTTVELRNHCAVALASLGHARDASFELEFALGDPDPLVRRRALEALIALGPSNLGQLLQLALQDREEAVRETARRALPRSRSSGSQRDRRSGQ